MNCPSLHRVQTVIVGTYFLLILVALAIIIADGGGTVIGGAFIVLYLSWGVVGLALCMGILVLLANGLYGVVTDGPDRASVALSGATVVSILVAAYLNAYAIGRITTVLVITLGTWGALVGPFALAVHVFGLSSVKTLAR
jgi:hypothetical protein